MQWFRMYSEFATDPVVQCLSFDDQRHFVMILCLKSSGLLDKQFGDPQIRTSVLKRAIGLDALAFEEARNRLCAAKLIDGDWQPVNWNKRQYISDADPTAAERKRKQRDKERHGRVTHESRPSESESDTETDKSLKSVITRSEERDRIERQRRVSSLASFMAQQKKV